MRDLIYFDFAKAASIVSQIGGGLRETLAVTEDVDKKTGAGASFGIPGIAEAKLGADYTNKRSILESRVLHHDLLSEVEGQLEKANLVSDLTRNPPADPSVPVSIREAIGDRPYLRVAGRAVIEDYRRILTVSSKFNEVVAFISKSMLENLKKSTDYLSLQKQIADAKTQLELIPDRNQKAKAKAQLVSLETSLKEKLKPSLTGIDDWLVDGLKLWIETFMPNRINFRIYPYRECPSFQAICNLKRDGFVDEDLEHLLYGYGNRPNVSLAVFGLVTSLPPLEEDDFDPLREFDVPGELSDRAGFEKGLRALFSGMEGIEALVRFSRYPNVTLHPIAVYRSFDSSAAEAQRR